MWNGCICFCAFYFWFQALYFVAPMDPKRAWNVSRCLLWLALQHTRSLMSCATNHVNESPPQVHNSARLHIHCKQQHRRSIRPPPLNIQNAAACSCCASSQQGGVHAWLEINTAESLCVDPCPLLSLSCVQDGGEPQQPADTSNATQRTRVAGRSKGRGRRRRRTG